MDDVYVTMTYTWDTNPIDTPFETPNSKIFKLRSGRDPLMIQHIEGGELVNFQHAYPFTSSGIQSDVSTHLRLGPDWKKYLLDIQPTDQYIEENGELRNVTRDMQERWLWSPKNGRPYFDRDGEFCFGLTNVASQNTRIVVDANGEPAVEIFERVRFVDGIYNNVPLATIDGFRPEMKAWNVDWLIEKCYIVSWAAVDKFGNVNDNVRGKIWQVNWAQNLFPCNLPGKKYIPLLYLEGYGMYGKE